MADRQDRGGGPVVPDLEIPASRPSTSRAPAAPVSSAERGASLAPPVSGKAVQIDVSDADPFGDMEIERGGGMSSPPMSGAPPSMSGRPAAPSQRPSMSGLALSAQPQAALRSRAVARGPSLAARIGAWALVVVGAGGAFAALLKYVHRGGRSFGALLPHAFDASSAKESGAFALTAIALAIGVGYGGLKARGRSWAMLGASAMLLVAGLAMVTVTLVATDAEPSPPDGALVIPYVMPLALALFGLGVAGRGVRLFLDGGARIALALVVAALGGAFVFAGVELSAAAALLPRL